MVSQLGTHRGHWLQAQSMNLAHVAWEGPFQDKVLNVEGVLAAVALGLCWALSGPVRTETPQRSTGWAGKVRDGIVTSGFLFICRSQGPHKLQICLALAGKALLTG